MRKSFGGHRSLELGCPMPTTTPTANRTACDRPRTCAPCARNELGSNATHALTYCADDDDADYDGDDRFDFPRRAPSTRQAILSRLKVDLCPSMEGRGTGGRTLAMSLKLLSAASSAITA